MINYDVKIDRENNKFIINGPMGENSIPIEIPNDNQHKKEFIDLFLHKADIERGIDFLRCIGMGNSLIANEGLFIAGLNNCMKCFKYSGSRSKLEKIEVFADNGDMLNGFIEYEKMRDKSYRILCNIFGNT